MPSPQLSARAFPWAASETASASRTVRPFDTGPSMALKPPGVHPSNLARAAPIMHYEEA